MCYGWLQRGTQLIVLLSRFFWCLYLYHFTIPCCILFFVRCYLKLGDWQAELHSQSADLHSQSAASTSLSPSTITSILRFYHQATEYDKQWYKAWHAWAFMNFQALLELKQNDPPQVGVIMGVVVGVVR